MSSPTLSVGVCVRTIATKTVTAEFLRRNYTLEARRLRKTGVRGIVVAASDSHGTCYGVRHPNGVVAFYEPEELVAVPARLRDVVFVRSPAFKNLVRRGGRVTRDDNE